MEGEGMEVKKECEELEYMMVVYAASNIYCYGSLFVVGWIYFRVAGK